VQREKNSFQSSDILKCKLEYPDRWSLLLEGGKNKPNPRSQSGPAGTQTNVSPQAEEKPAHHTVVLSLSLFRSSTFRKDYFVSEVPVTKVFPPKIRWF